LEGLQAPNTLLAALPGVGGAAAVSSPLAAPGEDAVADAASPAARPTGEDTAPAAPTFVSSDSRTFEATQTQQEARRDAPTPSTGRTSDAVAQLSDSPFADPLAAGDFGIFSAGGRDTTGGGGGISAQMANGYFASAAGFSSPAAAAGVAPAETLAASVGPAVAGPQAGAAAQGGVALAPAASATAQTVRGAATSAAPAVTQVASTSATIAVGGQLTDHTSNTINDGNGFNNGPAPSSGTAVIPGAANGVVISQIYGGGGTSSSSFNQDFVELFNPTTASVSVNDWGVQYADAGSSTWQVAALSGSIGPGQYLLVGGQTGSAGLQTLPTPDATSTIAFGAAGGKVALVNTTTALAGAVPSGTNIVDFVGYGSAEAYAGTGTAPGGDPVTATLRGNGGLTNSEDNFNDFYNNVPGPHNSASPHENLPPVNAVPASQWTPQNTSLVFSSGNGRALSVSDYEAGTTPVQVSLSVSNGTLTLPSISGLTFSAGTGTGDTTMTFTGTISTINADLNGLTYTPVSAYQGPEVLIITTDDLGSSGAGGRQSTTDTVQIAVGAPLIAANDTVLTNENTPVNDAILSQATFVYGGSLTLTILSGPSHGTATVNDNGTPTVPSDDYLSYTPALDFSGSDSLTYQVSDGHGNTATGTVVFTVQYVNVAFINVPADQADAEGDAVSLQLETPNAAGTPLSFTAAGLPAGLSINSSTGLISGTPLYTDAQTNGGQYVVTVGATGGGSTDTETFNWSTQDTNRIQLIDDQASRAGQNASFQPTVVDNLGDTLTYSATGLPTGLSINTNTGLISGTVAQQAPGITTFSTTLTVTGGGASDSQTFNWEVLSGSAPIVLFAINDTLRHDDDLALLNPATPLDVQVTLYDPGAQGPQSVSLSIPSGLSSLSSSLLQLSDGQTASVTLTPLQMSQQDDDVVLVAFVGGQQAGQGKAVNMGSLTIATSQNNKIRNADTPTGMADRIPNRVNTPYTLTLVGPATGKTFVVQVLGASFDNGRAYVWDKTGRQHVVSLTNLTSANFTKVGNNSVFSSWIAGTLQTTASKPGLGTYAGKLSLVVYRSGDEKTGRAPLAKTDNGFSIADIPVTISFAKPELAEGKKIPLAPNRYLWGAIYPFTVISDSDPQNQHPSDLWGVMFSEVIVLVGAGTGIYQNDRAQPVVWGKADRTGLPPLSDGNGRHVDAPPGTSVAAMARYLRGRIDTAGNGQLLSDQYFIFADPRTGTPMNADGSGAMVIQNSGFRLLQQAQKEAGNMYYVYATRTARANHGAQAGVNADATAQKASLNQ
jgi:hypothetical protein